MNSTIPKLDHEACEMIRELCEACGMGIDRIAQEKNLPRQTLAKLFVVAFERTLYRMEEDE